MKAKFPAPLKRPVVTRDQLATGRATLVEARTEKPPFGTPLEPLKIKFVPAKLIAENRGNPIDMT